MDTHMEVFTALFPCPMESLPGMIMPGGSDYYPTRDETIEYLRSYETKYDFPVKRGEQIVSVRKNNNEFEINTPHNRYTTKVLVSATGTFGSPYVPDIEGIKAFRGILLHSSNYSSPDSFAGKRVAIVGEGNSGAQILAEVSKTADTLWITRKEPSFLPDHIDGRYLFDAATQMYEARKAGKEYKQPSLGDIVIVESVKDARERNVLNSLRPFDHFSEDSIVWTNGRTEKVDAVIFCTGFKPALQHLSGLGVISSESKTDTIGTKSKYIQGLWLVGYGNWTGFASATLIGVGRSAKKTVEEIQAYLTIKVNQSE